jgi:hypothetical protein
MTHRRLCGHGCSSNGLRLFRKFTMSYANFMPATAAEAPRIFQFALRLTF